MSQKKVKSVVLAAVFVVGFILLLVGIHQVISTSSNRSICSIAGRKACGWRSFTSDQYGFAFRYPTDLLLVGDQFDSYCNFIVCEDGVGFNFPISYTLASSSGIWVNGSGMFFGVSSATSESCAQSGLKLLARHPTISTSELRIIGNTPFRVVEYLWCGPGACQKILQYSVINKSFCYRADLAIQEGYPLEWDVLPESMHNPVQAEANGKAVESRLQALFEQVLATFTILN